ncbi:Programmed cell death protein 2-like [Zancudomyces culisetae]|uniref:Programmed cell death protein 2-like n=1 Tax=Zancudomyces culisetae TaxID=1213189 RepID=A0A1R1PXV4_ZANCU|nr:Programmed cell death protein 2-like [Zancudomyces culisetae]|eukprot:OMH85790.1 Programmed cell death protein 2-like [Zancudomyces culisetae]
MDSNSKSKSANPLDSTKKLDFTTIWGAKNVQASVLGNATSSTDKKSISSFIFSPPSQSTVFSGNSVDVFGAKPISQEKKIEDELQELRIQDGNKNVMGSEKVGEWPTIIPHATSLYLDTEEEAFNASNFEDIPGKKKSSTNPVEDVSLKNDKDEKWEGEKYENSKLPRGMDEAMVKFMSIFGKNPEQVVRYQFGGVPLFYTLKDKTAKTLITETVENVTQRSNLPGNTLTEVEEQSTVYSDEDSDEDIKINSYSTKKLPKCPLCKGPRTFELQVMPSLISVLKLDGLSMPDAPKNPKAEHGMKNTVFHSSGIGMEFGTILVFSCQRNCHNGKYGGNLIDALDTDPAVKDVIYHEELVLIQSELD